MSDTMTPEILAALRELEARAVKAEQERDENEAENHKFCVKLATEAAKHNTERGLDLLAVKRPVRTLSELEVDGPTRAVLDEVLLEQSRIDVLKSHGLRPIQRMLFFGPPGCGKTSAAEVVASELGLELVVVRFDAVVSSFLGETAANLRKVFDFIASNRVVALFDEFDAIAKERDDPSEHGELRRVVNAFLQLLDAYRGESVVVAATNHEQLIDSALWRRFDEVVLFDRPTRSQFEPLLRMKLRGVRHELELQNEEFQQRLVGMSHADIERVVVRTIKQMVLKGREFVTMDLFSDALDRERHRMGRVATDALARKLADAEKWRDEYREKALAGQDTINVLTKKLAESEARAKS